MRKTTIQFTFAILFTIIAMMLMSCSHNGYGCKGNSKIMTRVTSTNPTKILKVKPLMGGYWYVVYTEKYGLDTIIDRRRFQKDSCYLLTL